MERPLELQVASRSDLDDIGIVRQRDAITGLERRDRDGLLGLTARARLSFGTVELHRTLLRDGQCHRSGTRPLTDLDREQRRCRIELADKPDCRRRPSREERVEHAALCGTRFGQMRDLQPVAELQITQLDVLPVQLELRRFGDAHGQIVARVPLFHSQHDARVGQVHRLERAARRNRPIDDHVHGQIGLVFVHVQLDMIAGEQLFQLDVVLRIQQEDALLARNLEGFECPCFEVLHDELILIGDDFANQSVRLVYGLLPRVAASHEEHRGAHQDRRTERSNRNQSSPPTVVGGWLVSLAATLRADHFEIDLQIREGLVSRLVAQRGVFLRQLLHDFGHVGRNAFENAVDVGQHTIRCSVPHHPRELLITALRIETRKEFVEVLTTHQVISGEAKRIEVALRTHVSEIVRDRFGCHVLRCSLEQAPFGIGDAAGQSEVAQLHAPPDVDHQVRGLDVSVNDPLRMQILQCPQAMRERCSQRPQIDLSPGQSRREAALHQLHHQPTALAHDVEDRDDVGMLERREQLCLLPEPVEASCVG